MLRGVEALFVDDAQWPSPTRDTPSSPALLPHGGEGGGISFIQRLILRLITGAAFLHAETEMGAAFLCSETDISFVQRLTKVRRFSIENGRKWLDDAPDG